MVGHYRKRQEESEYDFERSMSVISRGIMSVIARAVSEQASTPSIFLSGVLNFETFAVD
jgi:hypothetical protein